MNVPIASTKSGLRPVVHPYTYPDNIRINSDASRSKVLALCLNPIITPTQADRSCSNYSISSLLAELNTLTGYELPLEESYLESGLARLISHNHDFGIAYAWFRTAFSFFELPVTRYNDVERTFAVHYSGLPNLQNYGPSLTTAKVRNWDAYYQEPKIHTRSGDGDRETLTSPESLAARRFWDLVANRVVPSEWHMRRTRGLTYSQVQEHPRRAKRPQVSLAADFAAISHSWVDDIEMHISSVNNLEWPIPLPSGVTVEDIRNQILALRGNLEMNIFNTPRYHYEYCWLDVLCLRQAWYDNRGMLLVQNTTCSPREIHYGQLERQRLQEWKTDVPTIGLIYRQALQIYVYLNGIGRQYSDSDESWSKKTHWTQRAWTLQEWVESPSGYRPQILGVKEGDIDIDASGSNTFSVQRYLVNKLQSKNIIANSGRKIHDIPTLLECVTNINQRYCSNDIDRVTGLLYFFDQSDLPVLPVYRPHDTLEEAWNHLVDSLPNSWQLALSGFCGTSLSSNQLLPSWHAFSRCLDRGSNSSSQNQGVFNEGGVKTVPGRKRFLTGPVATPCSILVSYKNNDDSASTYPAGACGIVSGSHFWFKLTFTPIENQTYYLVPVLFRHTVFNPETPWDYVHIDDVPMTSWELHSWSVQNSRIYSCFDVEKLVHIWSKIRVNIPTEQTPYLGSDAHALIEDIKKLLEALLYSRFSMPPDLKSRAALMLAKLRSIIKWLKPKSELVERWKRTKIIGWLKFEFAEQMSTESPNFRRWIQYVATRDPELLSLVRDLYRLSPTTLHPDEHKDEHNDALKFLVCIPTGTNSQSYTSGVSYTKVGLARMRRVMLGSPGSEVPRVWDLHNRNNAEDELQKSEGSRMPSYNWRELFRDLQAMHPRRIVEKYGEREIYSIIYEG